MSTTTTTTINAAATTPSNDNNNEVCIQVTAYYAMQALPTDVLAAIASGQVDPVLVAKALLVNQGLDLKGQWIGFEKAGIVHGKAARYLSRYI